MQLLSAGIEVVLLKSRSVNFDVSSENCMVLCELLLCPLFSTQTLVRFLQVLVLSQIIYTYSIISLENNPFGPFLKGTAYNTGVSGT